MVDSFAATVGPSLIKHLLSSAVQIHVGSGLSPGLGASLLERRLDMIVTTDPPEAAIALERHPVLSERYVLLLPRAMVKGRAREHTLATLVERMPLVRFNSDSHIGVQIDQYLRSQDMAPPNRLTIDTADSLVAMVAGGIGWALITPLCLLQARANPSEVVPLALPGEGFGRTLTLVSRADEYGALPRKIARRAGEIFTEDWAPQLARLAPWLAGSVVIA
jgi:DNA-binding transcriptional LysR family regulator